MKWELLLGLVLVCIQVHGQQTFSKIYDLDTTAFRSSVNDMVIINEDLVVSSTSFCDYDTVYMLCGFLTTFGIDGSIKQVMLNDSVIPSGNNCLQYTGNKLYQSNKNSIYVYDLPGFEAEILDYPETTSSLLDNKGIVIIDGYIYLSGDVRNHPDPDSTRILKMDMEGEEIWRKYYSYGQSTSQYIYNLQATPDGNLAFSVELEGGGFEGKQINKIDTSGTVIDLFAFKDYNKQPTNRLLTTSDGGFVFSSFDHPFDGHDIFTTGYGLINKLDSEMDTLEWSLILPNDQLVDGRHYRIFDYIEAENGDIVACGMAYDNTDTELATGVPDKNSTWNGFIIRLTPDGEIIWLRLYKYPNDLLPQDEYGRFRPSVLEKIKELPDGRIVAAGNVLVNTSQFYAINELETEIVNLWLLLLDEHGCLDDYPCEEVIRINPNIQPDHTIGDEWIYEEEEYVGGGNGEIRYRSYRIQDTLSGGNYTKYILGVQDTFYIENDKMFFWDEYFQEYIMYFDFNATTSYEIKYYDPILESEGIATVVIDSVTYQYFDGVSLKVQHVHILNSGTLEDYEEVVYDGIGAGRFGIKFLLGCGLCDDNPMVTKLRCFIDDTMTYQFVPYSCDSTWFYTSVIDLEDYNIKVFPNPTSGQIAIEGVEKEVEYEIYTVHGTLIEKGITNNKSLFVEESGLYILKLKLNNSWLSKKIVRIE